MSSDGLTRNLKETLRVFDENGTPLTTNEVAAFFDIGRRSTYERLERLVENGALDTKKVGASARVWWRSQADQTESTEAERRIIDDGAIDSALAEAPVGIAVIDAAGEVVWLSETAERYLGVERSEIVGRNEQELVDEQAMTTTPAHGADEDQTDIERIEYHVRPQNDRDERWLERHETPIRSGSYRGGCVYVYDDITDRKRSDRHHRQEQKQFDSLIDAVEEYAIYRLDPDGYVQSWNHGAARIKGFEADEILGENFERFYVQADRDAGVPERNLSKAATEGEFATEGWRVRQDGSRFWASVTITPRFDEDGILQGFTKVTRDMTVRKEREREVKRERDLIERILEIAPIRLATFRPDGSVERINSRSRQHLGIEESEIEDFSLDDLEFYDRDGNPLDTTDHPVPRVIESGEPVFGQVVQHDDPDGARRWVSLNASPVYDDEGSIERIVVTGDDITELKQKQNALERQRDDLDRELDEMFERVDEAFVSLDSEWRFTYVNDQATQLLERPAGKLIGQSVWDEFPDGGDTEFQSAYRRARKTQNTQSFVEYYPPLDIWVEMNVYPSESGLSVYFQDVSERIARERELERYETIIETMNDGVYVVGESGHLTMINRAYAELLGSERADLIGTHSADIVDEEIAARASELESELLNGDRETARLEAEIETGDGETIVTEATFSLIESGRDGVERVGVVRDVTDRRRRKADRKRYEAIVETIDDGVYIVDDESEFVMVNDATETLTGYSRDALLGSHATLVTDESSVELAEQTNASLVESDQSASTIETKLVRKDGTEVPIETRFAPFEIGDERYGRVGVVRDITDRKARDRQLENRIRQQAVSTELAQRALEERELDEFLAVAVEKIASTLETEDCEITTLDSSTGQLQLRHGVRRTSLVDENAIVSSIDDDSPMACALRSERTVVVDDLDSDPRFDGLDHYSTGERQSAICTSVGPVENPWGALSVQDTGTHVFSEYDVTFVQSVAAIVSTAVSRHRAEKQLSRQRDLLAAMNSLNDIVRETTTAVIEQPTRERIERTVCENLVATDSYEDAWIGSLDVTAQTVDVRASARTENSKAWHSIPISNEERPLDSTVEQVARTGEIQIRRNEQEGSRSSATIPIVHDQSVFGVLHVATERPGAFASGEQEVIGQLGEVVGHAIAATQRKQALLSDELIEIEFTIPNLMEELDGDGATEGQIWIDHAHQIGDEGFLVYGSATPAGVDSLRQLYERREEWTGLTFREGTDQTSFELRTTVEPLLSAIVTGGGKLVSGVVENGECHMTIHLAPNTDPRTVIDSITDRYPQAELLRRRQLTRPDEMTVSIRHALTDGLTERQRSVLEAAYYAGFFESPREMSGTEMAAALDVSPPTFHQHLRNAERTIFEAVLARPTREQ